MSAATETSPTPDRRTFVGSSDTPAVLGVSPWKTRFELWHEKAGLLAEPDLDGKEFVFWGTVLEPAVAAGVGEKQGWTLRKIRRVIPHPTVDRMAASLDYEIVSHPDGPGVLEIKTADYFAFRQWEDGKPPLPYQLQLQHQLAVTGRAWGAIGVLVGGNRLVVEAYERHEGAIARIEEGVAEFWASIDAHKPPAPDYEADGPTLAKLYDRALGGKTAVFDPGVASTEADGALYARVLDLCAAYKAAGEQASAAENLQATAKAELLDILRDAERGIAGPYSISAKNLEGGKAVSYVTKPRRDFRITTKKAKEAR